MGTWSPRLVQIYDERRDEDPLNTHDPERRWTVREFDAAVRLTANCCLVAYKDVRTFLKTDWKELSDRVNFFTYHFGAPQASLELGFRVLLADPAEICDVELSCVRWSDGHRSPRVFVRPERRDEIDAYRSFCSLLVLVSRVEYFTQKDGDHAVATRVLRFLVKPEFLRRD